MASDLRARREALKLTQAQLAAELGVRRATISDRERGKYKSPISRETELAMQRLEARQRRAKEQKR